MSFTKQLKSKYIITLLLDIAHLYLIEAYCKLNELISHL